MNGREAAQALLEPLQLEEKPSTMMELLSIALKNNAAIDVIERLAALQEKQLARDAEIEFNEALNRVQEKIKRIAPDMNRTDGKSKWASYAAIDRVIRPIYAAEGMSLSFTHADCQKADHIRVICRVAMRGHKELYQVDWPVDTAGPKGGAVMTLTDATGASDSRAKRYLVKDIFNIAIGEGEADGQATNGDLAIGLEWIEKATSKEDLSRLYSQLYEKFEANPPALKTVIAANRKKRLEFK